MSEWYQAHQLSASDRAFVSTEYLTRQLIAYIGNKRRILGFLYRLFSSLGEEHPIRSFSDPFAGSGAVSRLARQMGMEVRANDWEDYSFLINRAHLEIRPEELEVIFPSRGGLPTLLEELNRDDGPPKRPFISRYYAPRDTGRADYRRERLFYTRENALFIDRIREKIDELYPREGGDGAVSRARDLLLALLLYEAATHVNTSGVFKAFHKGFGGHGRDALRRIMSPMELEMPVLHSSDAVAKVEKLDAPLFLKKNSVDLCYLDPPYTVHQYGSNYHLLNTIAKWDFPPVNNELGPDGRLSRKAGIRDDWTETKSDFCYRKSAPRALREVMAAADARYVVLSYNSEGIIPLDDLLDLLTEYGKIRINSLEYLTYRGGRQSLHRRTYNTEFQIVVEREKRRQTGFAMEGFITAHHVMALLKNTFVPERLRAHFSIEDAGGDKELLKLMDVAGVGAEGGTGAGPETEAPAGSASLVLEMENSIRFTGFPSMEELLRLDTGVLQTLRSSLEEASCRDRQEELRIYLDLLKKVGGKRDRDKYQRHILVILKKFTHKKYLREWTEELERIRRVLASEPSGEGDIYGILRRGLSELERIAELRFNG